MTHQIRIAHTEQRFPCAAGQTVLDAALQANIDMPYSCRKGVCGNCAGRIVEGDVHCPPSEVAPAGQRLLCQCVPASDLVIEPTAWQRVDPTARRRLTVRVFRNQRVADDVNVLHLRLPAQRRAKFRAGQYLQLLLPDGSRRSYSMANAPHQSDMVQLHVRHVPGGLFTQIVTTLVRGDLLQIELPYGQVALREHSTAPLVCVAGGTGFAPIMALLDDFVARGVHRPVTLVRGGRDRHGLYLPDVVQRWQRRWPDFRYLPVVEDAADAQALCAFHGRVDTALHDRLPTLAGHEVYCCGAPPMVAAVRALCVAQRGVDVRDFHADVFVPGPAAGAPAAAADTPG